MDKNNLPMKEIRLNEYEIRVAEDNEGKMIIEGYPIVFDQEAYIGWDDWGFYEKVDRNAFDGAKMDDVVLKFNHNDDFLPMARTRNKSLQLNVDDHGVFIHAELVDTSENRDIYKMVQAGLLTEGSFAFSVLDDTEELKDGKVHRTIKKIGNLFDVSICTNGAYGNLTEIYARSDEALETVKNAKVEALRHVALLKLRNRNKMKLLGGKK